MSYFCFFLGSMILHYIPQFLISCPRVSTGLQSPCNLNVAQHIPLPSAASNLRSKLCHHHSCLKPPLGDSETSALGSLQIDKNVTNEFCSFSSILRERTRNWTSSSWQCHVGKEQDKSKQKCHKFSNCFTCNFFLIICLVIADLWLVFRALTKLS